MLSLIIHAVLGLISTLVAFYVNAHLYRRDGEGSAPSLAEWVYYVFSVISVCIGWYFNQKYVFMYPDQASWMHFTMQLFDTPAGGSGAQDLIITNVIFFPMWTIMDGRRTGLKRPWIFFVMSLFTSFSFAMGLYYAAQERQLRFNARSR
jgi:hypothetical protein